MTDEYDYWDIATGEPLLDSDLYERYNDMLDDVYGDAEVAGYGYATSRALETLDPIAYRVGFSDWLDSELGETITDNAPEEDAEV